MIEYLKVLDKVLTKGTPRHGEKEQGTLTYFGMEAQYNFEDGFPLITVRQAAWNSIIKREAPWMLSGSTSANEAEDIYGLKVWHRWAEDSHKKIGTPPGELGRVYGAQFRHWKPTPDNPEGIDQMTEVIEMLRRAPETRRAVISLWDLDDVEIGGVKRVNVANCISMLHFARMNYKVEDGYEPRLDCIITHRSEDLMAGGPHDLGVAGLILMLVANELELKPGTLTDHIEDGQIYDSQIEEAKVLLQRKPLPRPTVTIANSGKGTIYSHRPEDFVLHNYQHYGLLKVDVVT